MSPEQVRAQLNQIIDPCSRTSGAPAGLDDMGLVQDVTVLLTENGWRVSLVLAVTSPMCLMSGVFLAEARARLAALPGVAEVEVRLDHTQIWSPDKLSSDYRNRLASVRNARRKV